MSGKICPIFSNKDGESECLVERCAWWSDRNSECCVATGGLGFTIEKNLQDINMSLEILTRKINN